MAQKNKQKQPDPPKPDEDDNDDDGGSGGDDPPLTRSEALKLVNSAVSGQLNRKLKPLLEKLDALGGKSNEDDDEDEGDDEGDEGDEDTPPAKSKGKSGKADATTLKLMKQLNKLKQQIKERDDKLAREAEERKAQKIEAELTKALTELGVDKNRMRGALAIHKAAALVDDETGNVIFRVKRDGYEEDLDPATALREWAGTDEGKSYLAPTGSSGGAGARPPRTPGPGRKPAPNSPEARAEKMAHAKSDLLSAVGQLVAGGSIAIE